MMKSSVLRNPDEPKDFQSVGSSLRPKALALQARVVYFTLRTSNLRSLTSNLRSLTSNLQPLTSNLQPLTSNLSPSSHVVIG